jgi:hypothetical protein
MAGTLVALTADLPGISGQGTAAAAWWLPTPAARAWALIRMPGSACGSGSSGSGGDGVGVPAAGLVEGGEDQEGQIVGGRG